MDLCLDKSYRVLWTCARTSPIESYGPVLGQVLKICMNLCSDKSDRVVWSCDRTSPIVLWTCDRACPIFLWTCVQTTPIELYWPVLCQVLRVNRSYGVCHQPWGRFLLTNSSRSLATSPSTVRHNLQTAKYRQLRNNPMIFWFCYRPFF